MAAVPMDKVLANELEIIGSHGMQAHRYPEMMNMIKSSLLQPEKLIKRRVKLSEVPRILPQMHKFNTEGVMVIDDFRA